jgi:uncharacterized membrane protein YesL
MFSFLIKKAFYDLWDNLFAVIILNAGYLIIFVIDYFIFILSSKFILALHLPVLLVYLISYIILLLMLMLIFVYSGAVSSILKDVANYQAPEIKNFFIYLKESYKASIKYTLIFWLFILLSYIAINFYSKLNINENIYLFKSFTLILVFWLILMSILSSQYYFPLQSNFDKKVFKNIKKMFLLFFDNIGFSIGLLIWSMVISILSIATFFIFLGPSAILLWQNVAFKLRVYKYEYLEKYPDTSRKNIPWDVLLATDQDKIGIRTLRNLIFPWKE